MGGGTGGWTANWIRTSKHSGPKRRRAGSERCRRHGFTRQLQTPWSARAAQRDRWGIDDSPLPLGPVPSSYDWEQQEQRASIDRLLDQVVLPFDGGPQAPGWTNTPAATPADTTDEQWLPPKDICAQLQIPEQTFFQWRVKHLGPRAYRIGKHLRISRTDFDSWLKSQMET